MFRHAALAAALVLPLSGCRKPPPTERVTVVSAAAAPALPEPEDDEAAAVILRPGDVVMPGDHFGHLAWKGLVDGAIASKDDEVIAIKRATRDGLLFAFAKDIAATADVPTLAFICQSAPKSAAFGSARCEDALFRRRLASGATAAYLPSISVDSPVGLVSGREVSWRSIPALAKLDFATLSGRPVALATSRWVKSGEHTGASLIVIELAPGLATLGELPLEEIDSRGPIVRSRQATWVIEGDVLRVQGVTRGVDRATGKETENGVINEARKLTNAALVVAP